MGISLKIIHCYSHLYSWTLKIRYVIFKNEVVGKIHFDCQIFWQLEIDEKKKMYDRFQIVSADLSTSQL